jgi:hypothetical protein
MKCLLHWTWQITVTLTYKINVFFQYHCHVLSLIGPTGVHLMLLVLDSVSDTWQDQLLMEEKNVQISSNLAEVNLSSNILMINVTDFLFYTTAKICGQIILWQCRPSVYRIFLCDYWSYNPWHWIKIGIDLG